MINIISQKGQSLIEAVVALGAAVLVISAIAIVVVTAVNNTDYAKYQNQANDFAQQGLEIVKNLSESSWMTFAANYKNISYCLPTNDYHSLIDTVSPCTTHMTSYTNFIREVDITPNSPDCGKDASGNYVGTKVQSVVYWTDGKCSNGKFCHTAEVDSCVFDINSKPNL